MTPAQLRLSWRAAATDRGFVDEWTPSDGGWILTPWNETHGDTGVALVSTLDVEVVGECPQPDRVVVTWRESEGAKRREYVRGGSPGVWIRTASVESGDGWREIGTERVTGLRVDRSTAEETDVTPAEP